jgi:hypothetical protein
MGFKLNIMYSKSKNPPVVQYKAVPRGNRNKKTNILPNVARIGPRDQDHNCSSHQISEHLSNRAQPQYSVTRVTRNEYDCRQETGRILILVIFLYLCTVMKEMLSCEFGSLYIEYG